MASHRGLPCLLTINRRPLDRSAYWKNIFLISHPNICCGYSKEHIYKYAICNLSDTVFAVDYSWGVFEGHLY